MTQNHLGKKIQTKELKKLMKSWTFMKQKKKKEDEQGYGPPLLREIWILKKKKKTPK